MTANAVERAARRLTEKYELAEGVLLGEKNVLYPSDEYVFRGFSFGRGAVLIADPALVPFCEERLMKENARDIFDMPILADIDQALRVKEKRLGGACLRFLRTAESRARRVDGFSYRWYEGEALNALLPEKDHLGEALNFESDVIAVAAYDGAGKLAACAGADDYMIDLWQIGIDTKPEYRGKGLATYLVSILADAIEAKGIVPYYTTWQANIASLRVALHTGFEPAWVEFCAV